jgi:uncharacterized protein
MRTLSKLGVQILSAPVRLWQILSPFRTPRCRFAPSCSHYAIESLRTHGVFRGSYLATRRVLRCHPWNPGGVDHVPPARQKLPVSETSQDQASGPRG